MKNVFNFYERTILENLSFEGYGVSPKTNFDKVQELYKIYMSEYKGGHNKHLEDVDIFSDWLRGLPSTLTVPFYNYDILKNAKEVGFSLDTEEKEDNFLENYWLNLSKAFFTLKENL